MNDRVYDLEPGQIDRPSLTNRLLTLALVLVQLALFVLMIGSAAFGAPQDAVCRVQVHDRDGAYSFGSGTLVNWEGYRYVLTNEHVVRGRRANDAIKVRWPKFGDRDAMLLTYRTTGEVDLAVLAIAGDLCGVEALDVSEGDTADAYVAGFGAGDFRISRGPVRAINPTCLVVGTPVRQGDSGGPILTIRGRVAGVLFGSGADFQGQTVGNRCRPVRDLLRVVARGVRRVVFPRQYIAYGPGGCQGCYAQPRQPSPQPRPPRGMTTVTIDPSTPPIGSEASPAGCDCEERLAAIEDRLERWADKSNELAEMTLAFSESTTARLEQLEQRPGMSEYEQRLRELESLVAASRPVDLGPLEEQITQLERRVAAEEQRDVTLEVLNDGELVGRSTGRHTVRFDVETLTGD